jgi:hypothetical protein
MDKTLLITRPEYDVSTHYLSKWSEEIIGEAQSKGMNVIDLKGDKANKKRVVGTLEKTSVKLAIFNGHGSDVSIFGQDDKELLETTDTKAVKDKIIYARACRAANILGNNAVASGATAFLGYTTDFIFFHNFADERHPLKDNLAELFLGPSNYLPLSLIKGHTTGKANWRSKNIFLKNIQEIVLAGKSSPHYFAVRYLLDDMVNQVCLGKKDAVL